MTPVNQTWQERVKDDLVGCHWCRFEARTVSEVWDHEEMEHPVERAEADRQDDRRYGGAPMGPDIPDGLRP